MIIRVTHHCTMGCRHCFIDSSGPAGEHMSLPTFQAALDMAQRLGLRVVLLSGGEPFDHPEFFAMLDILLGRNRLLDAGFLPVICSNGEFLEDETMFERLVALRLPFPVQIARDPRFYPRPLRAPQSRLGHPAVVVETRLRTIFPCRRTHEHGIASTRLSPACFNLRSATRSLGIMSALCRLERGSLGISPKACSPSINPDGSVVAGESDTCWQIGTVRSSPAGLQRALIEMRCDRCGLHANLSDDLLRAIGAERTSASREDA